MIPGTDVPKALAGIFFQICRRAPRPLCKSVAIFGTNFLCDANGKDFESVKGDGWMVAMIID